MSESNRSSGRYGGTAATVAGGIVLIYFGFPALWIWPFWKLYYGVSGPPNWFLTMTNPTRWLMEFYGASDPPDWFLTMTKPIGWLTDVFPAYQAWVAWGFEALGIN